MKTCRGRGHGQPAASARRRKRATRPIGPMAAPRFSIDLTTPSARCVPNGLRGLTNPAVSGRPIQVFLGHRRVIIGSGSLSPDDILDWTIAQMDQDKEHRIRESLSHINELGGGFNVHFSLSLLVIRRLATSVNVVNAADVADSPAGRPIRSQGSLALSTHSQLDPSARFSLHLKFSSSALAAGQAKRQVTPEGA
jgi:hypothetical protein